MVFASTSYFTSAYCGLMSVKYKVLIVLSVVNVKGLVGTFNHEMSLVGAFSVNVNLREVSFPALLACVPGAW